MEKKIMITSHARMRMEKYNIQESNVINVLHNPDKVIPGYKNRKIAQKSQNDLLLRVVCEKGK